jgi:hypothetical protein
MRTKTLLIAAAALAATVISSQAQVYSGIVGYASVSAQPGQYIFVANPMTTGNDVISNVLQNLPGATTAEIWNGAGFDVLTYSALAHAWKLGTLATNTYPLPPGTGFFLQNTTVAITNTFVGTVLAANGGSVTNSLGTAVNAIGSLLPISDTVTNTATFDLQVGGASTLQQWSVANQHFAVFTYSALAHTWKQGTATTNPVIGVAEGFFLQPSAATNWVQTLPSN